MLEHLTRNWWLLALRGVAAVIFGVLALVWPGITALALLALIAAWALVTGVLQIVAAIRLRREITNEWLLGLGGLVSVLFGILVLARPGEGALAVVWVIGIYAIIFGIAMIALGLRLRGLSPRATAPPTAA